MSFGSNLRTIRKYRKIDQSELGEQIGLSKKSAYSTISQYEREMKKPRNKETINKLADKLHTTSFMLEDTDLYSSEKVIYTLFWLAQFYGLDIDELDGQIILRFNQNKHGIIKNDVLIDQLSDWLEMAKKERAGVISTANYTEWMLNYPIQKPSFISKELDEYFDQLNTEFNNDELEKAYYECLKKKYESYK
ncbi:helix-turn-helix domain-containing protein [Candidatus Stoquefichus sp. SB1]|uniref:helix-turn-helix domain-containing protein n=1 Tax=Candidatus Stoquefichus sp. SB1 TaxID=1658109 RepID=UPI00067EACFB|nr:helix-turn-helix transcriptional regulator [Candidatus Stoquefichus sp. SB1]